MISVVITCLSDTSGFVGRLIALKVEEVLLPSLRSYPLLADPCEPRPLLAFNDKLEECFPDYPNFSYTYGLFFSGLGRFLKCGGAPARYDF